MNRKNTIYSKLFLLLYLFVIGLIVVNILYLAIKGKHMLSGDDIKGYANDVRSQTVRVVSAERGNIYSYDGDLIATDRTAYNVICFMSESRPGYEGQITYVDQPELTAEVLSKYITNKKKEEILSILKDSDYYQYIFSTNLSNVQLGQLQSEIEENGLNGIEFIKTTSRNYQYKHFASNIVGTLGLDPDNLDTESPKYIGVSGIEEAYDEILSGVDGEKVYQSDISGRAIFNAPLKETKAINGSDIYLSFDSGLQNVLEVLIDNAMDELYAEKMWCGVMDAHTGRMMAMVSRPDFDLQGGSEITNWQDLFLNNTYEVGSVIKPFVYLTAIQEGKYDGKELYPSGRVYVDGAPGAPAIQDWNDGYGWGSIPYDEGLMHSSNTAITHLLQDKNIFSAVESNFEKLGFFKERYVDGLYSAGGWASYSDTESPFDMVTMCFGQSATYSPYQVLRAFSVFANDGKMVEPYIVDHIVDANGTVSYSATTNYSEPIFSKDGVKHVRGLLSGVVNNMDIGTGTQYHSDSLDIFGKTGTGQIWDSNTNAYSETMNCYSFVGGAPTNDPQVLVFIGMEGHTWAANNTVMAKVVHTILPQALAKLNISSDANASNKVKEYTMESFVNQSTSFATKHLKSEKIKYTVIGDGDIVKKQLPEYNTVVSSANTVFLLTDADTYYLPDFEGWSRKDIATYLSLFNIPVTFEGTGTCAGQSVESGTDISTITELQIVLK